MVLFKYKYVYKGTSNDSSFLANKILNTLLKEWTNKWQLVVFQKKKKHSNCIQMIDEQLRQKKNLLTQINQPR